MVRLDAIKLTIAPTVTRILRIQGLPPTTSRIKEIDSLQIYNALGHYLEFGFDPPKERYKKAGLDYFQGGYFEFDAAS
jgi:asparagine synthase (glutamine-hydrolysing)